MNNTAFITNETTLPSFTDMDQITKNPVTKEELALYATYLNASLNDYLQAYEERSAEENRILLSAVSQLNDTYAQKFDALLSVVQNLADAIKGSSVLAEPVKAAPARTTNPAFINTMDEAATRVWLNKVWKSCEIIGKRCDKTKMQILLAVYKAIRDQGVDLYKYHKEWKQTEAGRLKQSQINMCASDHFRPMVESCLKDMYIKYYPEKYTINEISGFANKSTELINCPESVHALIRKYAKKHNITESAAFSKAYRTLASNSGVKLKEMSKQYAQSVGYKNCCVGYMISKTDVLMAELKRIVEA